MFSFMRRWNAGYGVEATYDSSMAAVKVVGGGRAKVKIATVRGRVRRLRERLEREQDPKTRAAILAQLAALDRPFPPAA
jgi:hypothetical protein